MEYLQLMQVFNQNLAEGVEDNDVVRNIGLHLKNLQALDHHSFIVRKNYSNNDGTRHINLKKESTHRLLRLLNQEEVAAMNGPGALILVFSPNGQMFRKRLTLRRGSCHIHFDCKTLKLFWPDQVAEGVEFEVWAFDDRIRARVALIVAV